MAFCDVRFRGVSIEKQTGMYVILPDGEGPFPVLYLLHGLSDDYTIWHRRTSIERYVEAQGLIVVMPDGHRSFYCNDPRPGGLAYEDHIVTDVVGFVERTFPAIPDRGARAIAGLSMGGYGAIMLALRHPDVFSVACSHSGAMRFAHEPIEQRPEVQALADALDPPEKYDCFRLAEQLKERGPLPAIRFDCGTEDDLLEWNREFHAHLDAVGIDHRYREYRGAHTWDYWDRHILHTLAFIRAHLPAMQGGSE